MGACQNSDVHNQEQDELHLDGQKISKFCPSLTISSYTWKKDSYNLFDYEAKEINKQRFKTSFSGHFTRSGNEVAYSEDLDPKQQLLFTFRFNNNEVRLEPQSYSFDSERSCWIIAKHQSNRFKGPQYHLMEGDYIKLGRVFFRLREINLGPKPMPMVEDNKSSRTSNRQRDGVVCRICLSDSFEDDDPLISPCNCTGSLKLIHLRCLKEWLNSKVNLKTGESYTYVHWEKLECELCKSPLTYQIDVKGKTEKLIDFEKPEDSIILETFGKKNLLKGFYILNIKNKSSFKMGRAIDNEIRINDISVSRIHAALSIVNNQVFFNDFDSKFGSLILLRKPMNLKLSSGLLPIQIGRTVFKIFSSWNSQATDAFCCKSIEEGKFLNPRHNEKIDEFEISEEGLEELSFEEMLMFSNNSMMMNQAVFSN